MQGYRIFVCIGICLLVCLHSLLGQVESSLDDQFKLRILGNAGYHGLLVTDGDEVGRIAKYNKCTPLDGCDYDFTLLFPDNYIGDSDFLYTFDLNVGNLELDSHNIYLTYCCESYSFKYHEVDLDTLITGEYSLLTFSIAYNIFRNRILNIRPSFGLGIGYSRLSGTIYMTDNLKYYNTLNSKCWDYTHTNESFSEITKYCDAKKIDTNFFGIGGHISIDFRIKYFGLMWEIFILTDNKDFIDPFKTADYNIGNANIGFYGLIPF